MGAFSNMDYELQNSEAAVSDAFTEDGAMDMPQTAPVEPATASSPTADPTPAAAASEPATAPNTQSEDEARRAHEASEAKRKAEWDAKQAEKRRAEQAVLEGLDADNSKGGKRRRNPAAAASEPATAPIPKMAAAKRLKPSAKPPTPAAAASEPATAPNTQSEDEARRAHEAAEAKRKAEWDAKQAEKRRAEQAALERLDAMGPAELLKAAAKRVSADTEKLTRRNMKESVAEFIQTKCIDDLGFARLTMHPRKSMIHCFQYISRKAWDYVQDELKANGVQPGPGQQGKTSSKSVSKKKKEEKKKEPEKKEPPKKAEADDGQISLGDLSSFGEAA